MTVAIDLFPGAAALGSSVRLVGTGMTGISAVTVGGASAAFTVTGDTDLVMTIPASGMTVDTFGNAEVLIDGDDIGSIVVGRPGAWQSPASVSGVSIGGTAGAAFTGLDPSFTTAISSLTEFGWFLDVPGNVGVIAPDINDVAPPGHTAGAGNWQTSQQVTQFSVAEELLQYTVGSWAGSLAWPDGALGVEVDLTAAAIDDQILSDVTLAHEWHAAPFPSPPGPPGGHYAFTEDPATPTSLQIRLIPASVWAPSGDPVDPVAEISPGSRTVLVNEAVTDSTATPITGTVDVAADLDDVNFGALYHAGGFSTVAVTGPQATGTEPSWAFIGSEKAGFIVATLFASLSFDWQPPRWRPIFAKPQQVRLRQYPRDDALGGQPRQRQVSSSTQATARQGWSGTYR